MISSFVILEAFYPLVLTLPSLCKLRVHFVCKNSLKKVDFLWSLYIPPHSWRDYYSRFYKKYFVVTLVSLSTLYGGKSFLILLLTSELASQPSPILRGF